MLSKVSVPGTEKTHMRPALPPPLPAERLPTVCGELILAFFVPVEFCLIVTTAPAASGTLAGVHLVVSSQSKLTLPPVKFQAGWACSELAIQPEASKPKATLALRRQFDFGFCGLVPWGDLPLMQLWVFFAIFS